MSRRRISIRERVYDVVDDCQTEYRAFIIGRLYDAVSGKLIENISVESDNPLLKFRLVSLGLFVLSGQASRIFTNPTGVYPIHVTLTAPNYRPLERDVLLNAVAAFPVDLGSLRLNPLPVSVQGRVTWENGSAGITPIQGAWIKGVDNPNSPVPLTEHNLVLRQRLSLGHAIGTTIRECQFAPSGIQRHVVFASAVGSTSLALDDVAGLAAGGVIWLGTANGYRTIAALGPRSYEITLNHPLNGSVPAGATIQLVTVSFPLGGLSTRTTQAANAGEGLLLVAPALDVQHVEIDGGAEYCDVGAVSNADGYYRLDGISHVQSIFFDPQAVGFQSLLKPVQLFVDYGKLVNKVDFRLEH